MKAVSFLLLALEVASASACANYLNCHCVNADGVQNDAVTRTICNQYKEANMGPGPIIGYLQCTSPSNVQVQLDNCEWRKACKAHGATGSDSSCWDIQD
jgi:hypothetical protein